VIARVAGQRELHPDRRKWARWINRIAEEVTRSAVHREVYRQWWEVIEANPRLAHNNRFVSLVWSSYFDRQVLFVRRQVDEKRPAVSLVRLLASVAVGAAHISRRPFVRAYGAELEANVCFDSFAGRTGSVVLASIVQADMARLRSRSKVLKGYSDQWLAHSDQKRRWPSLGFKTLDRALETIYETTRRYEELLRRGPKVADPKVLAGTDWQHVFDSPMRTTQPAPPILFGRGSAEGATGSR
jgi:hypothetical protein